jgi:hypothetical protein
MAADLDVKVDAYNRDVDKRNGLAGQLNALPC